MVYVITTLCVGTKDESCTGVCPVDCIEDGGSQRFIDPDTCIDCGACVPECPVEAIFSADEVPPNLQSAIGANRAFFGA